MNPNYITPYSVALYEQRESIKESKGKLREPDVYRCDCGNHNVAVNHSKDKTTLLIYCCFCNGNRMMNIVAGSKVRKTIQV